jgi:hypothetical protein
VQAFELAEDQVPSPQREQNVEPIEFEYVPAGQKMHEPAPEALLRLPGGHPMHCERSVLPVYGR